MVYLIRGSISLTPRARDPRVVWCRAGVTTFIRLMWGTFTGRPSTFDILLTGAIGVLTDQVRRNGGGRIVQAGPGEVFVYNGAVQGLFLRVWHLNRDHPVTWAILQNAVSLLKECMFHTGTFNSVSFEIFDGADPQPCGEGIIVLDPTLVANSNLIDWTVRATHTRVQIQVSNTFITSSRLRDLFTHALNVLDNYITYIEDTRPSISPEEETWHSSLGPDQPQLEVSSINSYDPQAWQALMEGVQGLYEYMQESNHWSSASAGIFNNDFKVGSVVIKPPGNAGAAKRSNSHGLASSSIKSRDQDTRWTWQAEDTNTYIMIQIVRRIPSSNIQQLLNSALDVATDQILRFHDSRTRIVAQVSGEIFSHRGVLGNLLRIVNTNHEYPTTWEVLEQAISALLSFMNTKSLWATAYLWIYDAGTLVARGTLS